MASDAAIEKLKEALRRLPGVGPRTAGRERKLRRTKKKKKRKKERKKQNKGIE
jgi:recombinational DNA repair protein RecR